MKYLITHILFLCSLSIFGQIDSLSKADTITLNASGKNLKDLIPKKWRLIRSTEGDLNGDGLKDIAFVIQNTLTKNLEIGDFLGNDTVDFNPRILAIYFRDKNKALFKKKLQSNEFIVIKESVTMEEPLDRFEITDSGALKINFHYWFSAGSWHTSTDGYTFKYQKGLFDLISYKYFKFHRANSKSTEVDIDFSERKMKITKRWFEEDENGEGEEYEDVKSKAFHLDKLQSLDKMKRPFEWEFEGLWI